MTDEEPVEMEIEDGEPAPPGVDFAALLENAAASVLGVSPDEAEKRREQLLKQRAQIDAQLALLQTVLGARNGAAHGPGLQQDPPMFPTYSGPPRGLPKKPTRRGVLLKAMAKDQGEWTTARMRAVLETAGMLGDGDTSKPFWALVSQLKKRGELEHTRPGTYKITRKGLEVALA
jgi:hypothetical protein